MDGLSRTVATREAVLALCPDSGGYFANFHRHQMFRAAVAGDVPMACTCAKQYNHNVKLYLERNPGAPGTIIDVEQLRAVLLLIHG